MRWIVLCIALLASPVWGDVVVLKDGTRLEGDLKRTAEGWSMTLADGKVRTFNTDAVKSIQPGGPATRGSVQSVAALASLRRSVEAFSDINQVIERYQRFIDGTKEAAVVADAQSDLAIWKQRKADGMVKHGTQWVMPTQVAELEVAATAQALDARDLLRQNRTREAEQLLQQALVSDPRNSAAQYLRGVMLYRQDRLVDSRKAFEAVTAVIADHAPSLNNIAVIMWRQNQQGGALNFYDLAMQAAGVNDYILNNVSEALGSMPEEQRRGTSYTRAVRRFAEQDQLLQQQMAQRGQYRWGSGWVDEKRLDELKASEREIKTKLEGMQAEYDQAAVRINSIAGQVSTNENTMTGLRINTAFRDGQGNMIMLGPPPEYFEFQRQNQELLAEQESLRTKMATLNEQAKRVRQELPVPRFTGVQQVVGVEGMPGAPPVPASQPTAP